MLAQRVRRRLGEGKRRKAIFNLFRQADLPAQSFEPWVAAQESQLRKCQRSSNPKRP